MIIGIGSDICDIRRIERTLERFGEQFEARVFSKGERAKADTRKGGKHNSRASTFAKRFAAKEAFGKALGTGVGMGGSIYWRDIEVVNLPGGKPTIRAHGGAAAALKYLMPTHHRPQVHVSLTDDYPHAQAFVIIEAVPE